MNRKLSKGFSLATSLALVLSLVPSASASTTPAVEYVVGEPAVAVAPDAAFSSGKTYTGSHVSFSIGNADAGDTLSMASDEQASIEADKISVVGSKVYIGTGTEAVQIGSVNDTQNGQTGKSLVIDFASPLANGSFEESTAGTDQVPGWTVNKNAVLLGDLAVKTQGRPVISSGSLAPFTVTGQDYSFQSDKAYRTGSQAYEAMEGSLNPTYTTFNSAIEKNGTSNVLRLWFSGRLDSVNPVNGTGQMVYQSAFGPEAWSDSFTAKQGDQISLDWRAANGGDDYEVYGFLYNVETEKYTEILYGRGRTQNWKTSSGEVPEDGTYKFRFVAGSYDASGGKALGASLYLDNIRVISGQHEATDAIIQQVIQKVTFENNRAGAGGTRTLTINAVASDQTAASSTVALNVYDLYKVLYDGNGATSGTAPSDAGKYQTAQKASVLANSDLTKTGHAFTGWNTVADGSGTAYKEDDEMLIGSKHVTLYAQWKRNEYNVYFDAAGGTSVEYQTVLYEDQAVKPQNPEKTGYTFSGWFEDSTLTDEWNFASDSVMDETTLYAKWTANPQTIQFDADGGSAVSDLTVDYDEKITQPDAPTKAGHTFKGWQFEGSVWDFEKGVVKGDMTLMADWQINSYSLEFEPNGGSEEAAQTVVYNTHAAKPTDPVKTGYTFGGWFTDEEWENEWSFEENVMTEDTVLKAKWTINSYVVTFHANRGSDVEPATVVYQEKAEKPSNPTRPGYSFVGWYTDEQLRSAYDFEAPVTADTSLYARWSSNAVPLPPSEDIVVDIISDGKPLVQTPVKRTTNPDGKITDSVTFTAEKASEFVQKQGERAGIARIVIPDSEDKVAETTVNVPSAALDTLKTAGSSLEMDTVNARILVPSASIAAFDQNLYFRVVPVKEEAAQQEIEERARQDEATGGAVVSVLGRPMTIETNMQNRPVTLTLPLPVEATEEELENLSVFIEHSNGTKEVVSGTVVEWKNGQKAIQFSVNHFSTFTILSMEAAMQEGTHEAYIHGFKDGTFRPDETVTRAQIAAMIVRNLEMTYNGKISYTDTKQSFAVKEIEMAREAGIILGFSDGTFRPDQAVTRGQVAAITSRFVQNMCGSSSDSALCETGSSLSFPDVEKDYWAAEAIQHAASVGIISGFGNGTFRPEQPITRAQAVVMLNRLFERGPLNGVEKPTFTDVPTSHWAFGQVEEGATTHSYTIDEQGNEWVQ